MAPRIGTCLLALALVVGACGGDDDDTSNVTVPADTSTTESTTTTEPATTSTTEDPAAAVEAAFFAQWDAFVAILGNPDPANPLIDRHFTGEARESLLDSISDFLQEGKRAQRPADPAHFSPAVLEVVVEGETAVLFECTVDGIVVVDAESGEVLNDEVSTYALRNEFRFEGGAWKLSATREPTAEEPACDG